MCGSLFSTGWLTEAVVNCNMLLIKWKNEEKLKTSVIFRLPRLGGLVICSKWVVQIVMPRWHLIINVKWLFLAWEELENERELEKFEKKKRRIAQIECLCRLRDRLKDLGKRSWRVWGWGQKDWGKMGRAGAGDIKVLVRRVNNLMLYWIVISFYSSVETVDSWRSGFALLRAI